MHTSIPYLAFAVLAVGISEPERSIAKAQPARDAWRSALYPDDWTPDFTDEQGRFLHDFSYAGYARGEQPIPDRGAAIIVINAGEGDEDDTGRIQSALTRVGEAGGGVVQLGPGTFRIAPPNNAAAAALEIRHSGVVLRGAGPEATLLINTEPAMRGKHVILVGRHRGDVWRRPASHEVLLAHDARNRTQHVMLTGPGQFTAGDWIVLRQNATEAFISDHDMEGLWSSRLGGIAFYRQITAVNDSGTVLHLDIPLRYDLLVRDRARVYTVAPHLDQCGVEDLSIGMVEHPGEGWAATDYTVLGTAAHDVHSAHLITMSHVVNGWIRNVHTARPEGNAQNVHMVSNGILLSMSRNITIADCILQRPQYRGGGGNGYGIIFQGSDCLVTATRVMHCRHNFSFKSLWTTGNVVHRSRAEHGMLASDFHMHLSPANLFDAVTVNRDWLEARYRPYGTIIHGHTTTQSVFWNTQGEAAHLRMGDAIVDSRQCGWGYIIGTQGNAHAVRTRPTEVPGSGSTPGRDTAPEDYTEGIGRGETLVPQSLYDDQLRRRLQREPR